MPDILTQLARCGPALVLALVGGTLALGGLRRGPADWLAHPGAGRAFVYLYTFRRVVVGLALIAAAIGWAEQIAWLVAASVTIGIGEWLESSYYLLVMNRLGPAASAPPARALQQRRLAAHPAKRLETTCTFWTDWSNRYATKAPGSPSDRA